MEIEERTCETCQHRVSDYVHFKCVNPSCNVPEHNVCMDCYHVGQRRAEQMRRQFEAGEST